MSKVNKQAELLSDFDIKQLQDRVLALKKELFNLRFQKTLGDLKNTSRFSEVRKNIARVNTEISARKSNRGN
ncbi:MAG: 50S ribosomal protein L29 [Rickettsiaceae bacterium]|nr:50S ribosomal protein L29 [Rickettsiaceae bacterium]